MKKLLTLLLTLLMVLSLVGCASKKEEAKEVINEQVIQEEVKEENTAEELVGGFIEVEDRTLTDELKEIFNKAYEGYTGMSLEPVELYQTQVVAGINYKFVCSGTKTTNPPIHGTYFVTVYKDLQGNCSIIDIETITEGGDVDGDISQYKYWVVFYDQYGNELQREALKYGTIPMFKGSYPSGFDSWDRTLTAIKGNTYIHARCHEVKEKTSDGGSDPTPTPTPTPSPEEDNALHKGDIIYISSEASGYQYYLVLKVNGDEAMLVNMDYSAETQFASDNSGEYENSLLDTACNTTFYGNLSSTLQNAIVEKTISLNQYTYDDTNYNPNTHPFNGELSSKTTLSTIDRKVYALDIEDIYGYLGSTYSIDDVNEITSGECWFRSITSDKAWCVTGSGIDISNRSNLGPPIPMTIEKSVRPSFVIDLTQNVDYQKQYKVSLVYFNGSPAAITYTNNKDAKIVDLTFNVDPNTVTFAEKTYGANTIYLLDFGGYYAAGFTIAFNQLINEFTHNELISIEKLFADDIRGDICELDYDEYDPSASSWSEVQWDSVTPNYDMYMLSDVVYSFFVIDDYYSTNSSAYDVIINKLKPYFVSSDLTAKDNVKIYFTTG